MQIVNECIELVKHFEGLHLEAYICPSGRLTIGYGHTVSSKPSHKITEEEAEMLLMQDLNMCAEVVKDLVKVKLNDYQFSALVSFVFNVGSGNFKNSTLLKKLNAKDYKSVPIEMMRWVRAKDPKTGKDVVLNGLIKRRKAEIELWNKSPK